MSRRLSPDRLLPLLFLVSGATALAGQVVLNRLLTYVFGASHLATSTVLAAYMGGLALGALLASRFAPRLRRPVAAYGVLELGVAAFFALLPLLYPGLQAAGNGLGRALGAAPLPSAIARLVLSFSFVLVPTVLMGATLPVLLSSFAGDAGLRRRLPWLYAVNTLGGAAGAFLAGYFLVYALGLDGTAWACAVANATVGLAAIGIAGARGPAAAEDAPPAHPGPVGAGALSPAIVCALAFAQGALSFSLEVTWAHLIRTVIGVTTYAFTVMLTVILVGIGLGSLGLSLRGSRGGSPLRRFVLAQLFLAFALASSLFVWDRFPDFVAASLRHQYHWSFAAREALRFVFAVALLLPAGLALGVSLPALAASVRPGGIGSGGAGSWVGRVFGFNTLGAISGALFTGFVLLGRVSSEHLLRGAVLAAFSLAVAAAALAGRPRRAPGRAEAVLAVGAVAALVAFPGWDLQRLTSGKHFMWDFYSPVPGGLRFVREDAQSGFITVEQRTDGLRIMKTNGKYEGTDADVEFQDNFALMGALYLRRYDRAALLGLGPGRTLALLHEMPFRRIEVMEFSPGIIEAARTEFAKVSHEALSDGARVHLVVDDGRNHLQLSTSAYDYVVVGVSAAAFAGTGSIYNRDFFDLVRSRLAPGGVCLLWIQIHHVFPQDVRSVAFTLRRAFPHVHFYAVPEGQGFLVASESPLRIDTRTAAALSRTPRAARALGGRGLRSALDLVAWNVFSRDEDLQRYFESPRIAGGPELYTDLRPRLEFTAPMGLATALYRYDFGPFASPSLPELAPPLAASVADGLARSRDDALGRSRGSPGAAPSGQSAASSAAN